MEKFSSSHNNATYDHMQENKKATIYSRIRRLAHICYLQIFKHYQCVVFADVGAYLVQIVLPDIGDLCVQFIDSLFKFFKVR